TNCQAWVLTVLVAGLISTGCRPNVTPTNNAQLFRLFDLFQPNDLTGKVTPEDAGWKHVEWMASGFVPWTPPSTDTNIPRAVLAPSPTLAFRALNDIADTKVEQGRLNGNIIGASPVLQFTLDRNRGGADPVKFIEVRMTVSGAKQVFLRAEANPSVDDSE